MSKILVIFGATGQQGGSVIEHVNNHPELLKQYKIRAVTRDVSGKSAQDLAQKGIETVQGDLDDAESLKKIMEGAHTVFGVTFSIYKPEGKAREIAQGKALVDAAVNAGAYYFIWSTCCNATQVSGGKYRRVTSFDAKAEVEEYIRLQPIKSAFFAPGVFMQNFHHMMAPKPVGDGTYAISNMVTAETEFPLIEALSDSGKYVGAILAEQEKYEGKVFSAATQIYTYTEIAEIISKVFGKIVKYNQIPEAIFRSFMPLAGADTFIEMFLYYQDFGYYGPETREKLKWTTENTPGNLTTFEEHLKRSPIILE